MLDTLGVTGSSPVPPIRTFSLLAARGDQATELVILASIVIPLAILGAVCWYFWRHRHDE
jgi:hypothetical protein